MFDQSTNVILCADSINYSSLPIAEYRSNAMIPVNNKPVIAWILNDLLQKKIFQATIVLQEEDYQLKNFITRVYAERMKLTLVPSHQEGTIIQSLQLGLKYTPPSGLVRIILGDTFIREEYESSVDFVYVGSVEETRRWCIAEVNEDDYICDLIDKREAFSSKHKLALAGYYHLLHGEYLVNCVNNNVEKGVKELSPILLDYNKCYPIKVKVTREWFDFGNIDNLIKARRLLLQPRHFNALQIDSVMNTITKSSENNQKLSDELDWYLQIPNELKVLTPRIINYQRLQGKLRIIQEFYGYPTLADIFTYGNLDSDTWLSILKQVMRIHDKLRSYTGHIDNKDIQRIYIEKTWERLEMLKQQDTYWLELLTKDIVILNRKELQNIETLRPKIEMRVIEISGDAPICIIHGDYCFSNILFDLNNQIVRLIDPRGSFGKKGIYGDARYDIAKLRHSVCSLYDFITNSMYEIKEDKKGFVSTIFSDDTVRTVGLAFDELIVSHGYNLDEIRFIEALLFISMTPLHRDNFKHQQMMYLRGIQLLNEVL